MSNPESNDYSAVQDEPKDSSHLYEAVSDWLAKTWDPTMRVRDWWSLLAQSGWGFPTWPVQWYGKALTPTANAVVQRAMADSRVLGPPWSLAQRLGAPMLFGYGTSEQHEQFLPGIASGEEAWCEMFSEPGAGSDLAGLQTKAWSDGDRWIVKGQKLWTSGAQYANRAMLLARTDSDAPKHRGITVFIMDVDQPGIEIRPIKTMNGHAHFNEVFLDGAEVGNDRIVGPLHGGWRIAMDTLALERFPRGRGGGWPGVKAGLLDLTVTAAMERAAQMAEPPLFADDTYPRLLELARRLGRTDDPLIRQGLARLYAATRIQAWAVDRARLTQGVSAYGSQGKLARAAIMRLARELGLQIAQSAGMTPTTLGELGSWLEGVVVTSPGESIAGGTAEIQRNVIGERVLGLPRDRN